ncbi:MAG: DUF3800 domain-containing protein [Armatimonadota bacterium]|nr:DUF3800 domain-containing protein [Armatimonadota bacterium]
MAGGILPREPPGRSLGKTSGSPPMAGGILPGFLLSEVRKVILLVSDESGDLGLKGSRCYIVLTLLFRSEHDARHIMDIANALSRKHFHHPLRKWNNMKGKYKNAPQTLAAFLADLLPQIQQQVGFPLCAVAAIMDKTMITHQRSPKLYESAAYRMGWCYRLAFKRIGHFLQRAKLSARWIVDDNSELLKRNLSLYLTEKVPELTGFIRLYSRPIFCSPKDQPILTLADFLAGLTGRCFESFVQSSPSHPSPFQPVWSELKKIFHATLNLPTGQVWHWDGLLYWPIEHRDRMKTFLNRP